MDTVTPPTPLRQKQSQHSFHGDAEQSGRSSTNLNAQRSSASLSQLAQRSNPPSSHSSPRPSLSQNRPGATPIQNFSAPFAGHFSDIRDNDATPRPLPLPASPTIGRKTSSLSSGERSPDGTQTPPSNAAIAQAIAGAANLPPPPRIPASRGDISSRGSWSSATRVTTPRSVRDLGSDYSRYYNPFTSQNNSTTDLRSLAASRNHSSSNLNMPLLGTQERRHSNPFDDGKKLSRSTSDDKEDNKSDNDKPTVKDSAGAAGIVFTGVPLAQVANGAPDPEKSFFPYLDDRLGAPAADAAGYNFPMMWDEKEDDDDMHMPMVDDDIKLRPTMKDRFTRENICTTLGFFFMTFGLFTLFIVLPVISSTGISMMRYPGETPLSEFPNYRKEPWATVNDRNYPLLKNVRSGLIDPDTPADAMTKQSLVDGKTLSLVFSDEFNKQNRTFYKGDDPYFFAANFWYGATQDLEWYDPDAVTVNNGVLELKLEKFRNHGLDFRSGMLNSWNQLCFKGGIWEVSVSLPGPAGVHGLWPGVWSMGNLGRPGHLATTDGLWPYTYDDCDAGITPNQSMTDGTSRLPGQRLASCTCRGEDHPNPGRGRGAPEIDIVEAAADYGGMGWGTATQSFQVAPFDIYYYPNYEFFETPRREHSVVNTYTGGPFQEAVSVTTVLNTSWYDGKMYQRYSYDYRPGSDENAWVSFNVADEIQGHFDGRALGPNGNVKQRLISEEPMSMIMNLGISNSWTTIQWDKLVFPSTMRIDYVRLYQREGEESVTCDPPGYPTTQYIANHPAAYNNPNYTLWSQIPGYTWPKNELMNGCSA